MLPLTLLLAMDEPPPTELATVSFSANGQYALVETRWVLDGPGFPVARVEVFALSTGKHVLDRQVELREGAASAGPIGATAQARACGVWLAGRRGRGRRLRGQPLRRECGVYTGGHESFGRYNAG